MPKLALSMSDTLSSAPRVLSCKTTFYFLGSLVDFFVFVKFLLDSFISDETIAKVDFQNFTLAKVVHPTACPGSAPSASRMVAASSVTPNITPWSTPIDACT